MTDESPSPQAGVRPARTLALLGVVAGGLTIGVGLGIAAIGMGFVNATAAGTGMAGVGAGVWSLLACRGLWRRRPMTLAGLGAAWLWLVARVGLDWPAVAVSAVVVLFLAPRLSVPLGVAWGLVVVAFLVLLAVTGVREFRRWRRAGAGDVKGEATFGSPRAHAPPLLGRARTLAGLALRLGSVVAATLIAPHVVWLDRSHKIDQLASTYASTNQPAATPVTWGACTGVFLGYELTQHGAERVKDAAARQAIYERTLADALAELDSIRSAGARWVRVGASGDHLVEFKPEQEAVDDRYMKRVRDTGLGLVLVDTQHPKALRNRKVGWADFCQFQRRRIEYYQRRYEPEVYFVVCEPLSYHAFALTAATSFSAAAWATQLADVCRLIKSIRPSTRTGMCLLVMPEKEPEWEVWARLKTLPELDLLAVEIYSPENFRQTEQRLAQYGHPRATGKAFWVAETFNGWALCGDRRWELDAAWLPVCRQFASQVNAEAVLVWTFGSFVPGGNFRDFGRGRLAERWRAAPELSLVGQTFQHLARGSPQPAR